MFKSGDIVKHHHANNLVMEVISVEGESFFTGKFISFDDSPQHINTVDGGWRTDAFYYIGRMHTPDPVLVERWFYQALDRLESCLKKVNI